MTVLCIETSTKVCSAALCKDGALVEQCIEREEGNHARLLPTYIDQLLRTAKAKNMPIDAVALSEGPGSYTGLRIGTSTAKGLCYGLNVPLIPISTLQILGASAVGQAAIGKQSVLCPMIDARRMEVYCGMLHSEGLTAIGERARAVVVESEASITDNTEMQGQTVEFYYFGDGAAKCQSVLGQPNWHYIADIVPEAQYMGRLAESAESRVEGTELAYYEPYYLKEFVAAQSHVKGLK